MIGTVRLNLVDGDNRVNIKEAQGKLKDSERGHWALCEVYNAEKVVAQNCGYIVFKDKNIVTFYTNALADTPNRAVDCASEHAVKCVHGLEIIKRWTGP